jgi:hypothetical protein
MDATEQFGQPWRILTYDVGSIPLVETIRKVLEVDDLENLEVAKQVTTREDDQRTVYHARFYDNLDLVLPLYRQLLATLLGDRLSEVYYQRVPTFRVHLRGSLAVGTWHRDRDFGHDPAEVNYWTPMTRAYDTNTVWIDEKPVTAGYGDVVTFDGANLLHGNKVNESPTSRVSFDFRTIARSAYKPSDRASISAGIPFLLGQYWEEY